MFTGLVEHVGKIVAAQGQDPLRLTMSIPSGWGLLPLGSSVAVDGVCLTVVARDDGLFSAEVGAETWKRTALGGLRAGAPVHLERALKLGAPLDGHLMLGHVDGLAVFDHAEQVGATNYLYFKIPLDLLSMVAPQGSVAISGVSLTVVAVDNSAALFSVAIVPHTWQNTKLGSLKPGDHVNIEVDPLARYIHQAMAVAQIKEEKGQHTGITMDMLRSGGYL